MRTFQSSSGGVVIRKEPTADKGGVAPRGEKADRITIGLWYTIRIENDGSVNVEIYAAIASLF